MRYGHARQEARAPARRSLSASLGGQVVKMMRRALVHAAWICILVSHAACASVQPRPSITLHITNQTCQTGQCMPLQIVGFPSNSPGTLGKPWTINLGVVTAAEGCLVLPPVATFSVSRAGSGTDTFEWTAQSPLSIGTQVVGESGAPAAPHTFAFVPSQQPGWSVTLPGGELVSPATPCVH